MLLEVQWQNIRRGSMRRSLAALLEMIVLARAERRALGRANHVVVVSEPNRRLARRLNRKAHVTLIPNCVDVEYFKRTRAPADHPVIVMTASFHYPPNRQAASELLRTIFPAVRARVQDAELRLVGQRMPEDLRSLAVSTPGVTVVGEVDDVRPELERARVAVAPLWTGSGSPLKVLEAMAMDLPVVTTPRVRNALGLGPSDGVLIANDVSAMANEISLLLEDEERRATLAAVAGSIVRDRFDSREMARSLERVWETATLSVRR